MSSTDKALDASQTDYVSWKKANRSSTFTTNKDGRQCMSTTFSSAGEMLRMLLGKNNHPKLFYRTNAALWQPKRGLTSWCSRPRIWPLWKFTVLARPSSRSRKLCSQTHCQMGFTDIAGISSIVLSYIPFPLETRFYVSFDFWKSPHHPRFFVADCHAIWVVGKKFCPEQKCLAAAVHRHMSTFSALLLLTEKLFKRHRIFCVEYIWIWNAFIRGSKLHQTRDHNSSDYRHDTARHDGCYFFSYLRNMMKVYHYIVVWLWSFLLQKKKKIFLPLPA